jgi:hypothetical protein
MDRLRQRKGHINRLLDIGQDVHSFEKDGKEWYRQRQVGRQM